MLIPAMLIFDIGKTNKKALLFDAHYNVIDEQQTQLPEIKDEDGFPCENVHALTYWVQQKFEDALLKKGIEIKAVNFSAYGASFVHVDKAEKILTPLYNYLKPYPEKLQQKFYDKYGGESVVSVQTESPVLGSLNSGLQLYRLKYEQPGIFKQIKYSLHLPQYLSYIITKKFAADITSIGCHTMLWNFQKHAYHDWVFKEELHRKFPNICASNKTVSVLNNNKKIAAGIGLHDSSAALIPYLKFFNEPFILISTGTWCISLNPFNASLLTDYELQNDCLCYLTYEGKPVKASRLFAGHEHEVQVKKLAAHFNKDVNYYKTILFDNSLLQKMPQYDVTKLSRNQVATMHQPDFSKRILNDFKTYEEAYHQLMLDIIHQQFFSTKLILNSSIKKIFVDGGFGKNDIYMNLLALAFPGIEVYAADIAQASALGAAIAINIQLNNFNTSGIISLKYYGIKNSGLH